MAIPYLDGPTVDKVLNAAHSQRNEGGSRFPGMSYEDGLIAAIEWLRGDTDDYPYPEE